MRTNKPGALLLFFAAGTCVMIYVMSLSGRILKSPDSPRGIIDLEFAYNKTIVENIIHAWKPGNKNADRKNFAKQNIYYDFLFLLFYSPFLFLCCKAVAIKNNKFSKLGNAIAKGALVAGLLDVLENVGMLQSLNGNISSGVAVFTFAVSVLKWLLVLIAVLFILFALFRRFFQR